MNYRHVYHAGNFADVVKHLALIAILQYLQRKPAPIAVIDTHAGRGAYDVRGEEAVRTGEAAAGIGRLATLAATEQQPPLRTYLDLAANRPDYPGSPLIAARLLRPQDRLVAIEKHPEEAAQLAAVLRPFRRVKAVEADGYAKLSGLLPPPERRGVVLIDPPFEQPDEFPQCAHVIADAHRRFATGHFLIWFPVKSPAEAMRFCAEVQACGPKSMLRVDTTLTAAAEGKLPRSGLLLINPPYGFETAMRAALAPVLPRMDASIRFEQLAGTP